jgi:hypothetical protein
MEVLPGEEPRERARRGSYYAKMRRIQFHREFFGRAYAMQPRCSALFGVEAENAFNKLHEARRAIELACEMLTNHIKRPEDDEALWFQLRADILGSSFASKAKEPKRVDDCLRYSEVRWSGFADRVWRANDLGSTVGRRGSVFGARARGPSPKKQIPANRARRGLSGVGPLATGTVIGPGGDRPTGPKSDSTPVALRERWLQRWSRSFRRYRTSRGSSTAPQTSRARMPAIT